MRPRAQTDNTYRMNRRAQVLLSPQAYDDIAAYQSQVYGNQQLVLAKKSSILKHKPKPKHKHRKCIKINLVLKKLKDRMIDMDELSSVMISKHKMRLTVFESDKFIEKRGTFDVFRGATFELQFDIHEINKLPHIYCLKNIHHPNIDSETGKMSLSYNIKYYVKSKKKYVDKIWSLIVSLVTVLESPSLYRDKDILNKKAAQQFRRGSVGAISYTDNNIQINEEKEINNNDIWIEYIDLDEENKKREKSKKKNKVTFNDGKNNKNVGFGLAVPTMDKNNISSVDFDSNEMQQLTATIGAMNGFKLKSC
eukprot:222135_1